MPQFNLYSLSDVLKQMRHWNLLVNKVKSRFPFAEMPPTFKMEDMKSFIKSDEDVERFGAMLGRFNKSEAQTVDPSTGRLKFLDNELQKAVDDVTAMRNEARANAYPEWEMMGMMDKVKAMTQGNIAPVTGEYTRPEDLGALLEWYSSEQVGSYIENYLASVVEYMTDIYDTVESAIYTIMEYAGDRYLKAIFDRGYIETQIEYVYPQKGSAFAGVSDAKRMRDVKAFWIEQEEIALRNASAGKHVEIDEYAHDYKAGRKRNVSRVSNRTSATWL